MHVRNLEGSYLLGEADGEIWSDSAPAHECRQMSSLAPEDIIQRDAAGPALWLRDRAELFLHQDTQFDPYAYYSGFLSAVHRFHERYAMSFRRADSSFRRAASRR